jgi:hypothetical protein
VEAILTGLVVTTGEVNDGMAFDIKDFVSLTGLNLRHSELVGKW